MASLVNVSLCLSDIPKDRIKVGKNGKKYLLITVSKLREPDNYENTHSVYVGQTKDEREQNVRRTYIGKGKEIVFHDAVPTPEEVNNLPAATEVDDLPF